MSSVNNNSSRFSYTPELLMKALDMDKKGYVTQDDISSYRDSNKLSKSSTAFLDALSDEAIFNEVSTDRNGSGKIIREGFEWLASRGGNFNKIDNADMVALRQGTLDLKKSDDEQQLQIERRQSLNASYLPESIMKTLDKDKNGFITPAETKDFKSKNKLGNSALKLLAYIDSAYKQKLTLPVYPAPKGIGLQDLIRWAKTSGDKKRLDDKDIP